MKLVYQYMAIFFNFSPTSNHLHPLQVENCDSNSRLVVDEDGNVKFRLERVKPMLGQCWSTVYDSGPTSDVPLQFYRWPFNDNNKLCFIFSSYGIGTFFGDISIFIIITLWCLGQLTKKYVSKRFKSLYYSYNPLISMSTNGKKMLAGSHETLKSP